jgi:hypothetical protein
MVIPMTIAAKLRGVAARARRVRAAPAAAQRLAALGLIALLLLPSLGWGAEVRAFLNQTQVYEGDQVVLTIERAGRGSSSEPDLSPLAEDFEVGRPSTSQQTQIINGRRSDQTRWQVGLRPKRLGRLPIPPIQVGSASTAPLSLSVEAVPEGGLGGPGDQVWLEVELGGPADDAEGGPGPLPGSLPGSLVVQQQVPLVVRAYSAQPLLDYQIEMPAVEGAVLTRIGRDQGSLVNRAGKQYRVIERRYSLNPERSGRLRIPPITFDAELKTEPGRGVGSPAARGLSDLFDDPMIDRMLGGMRLGPGGSLFERGELARAQSEALVLEVAASAQGFSGEHWLPATALTVEDSWASADGGEPPRLAVGEPATRTLTLTAYGLAGNQIPEVAIPTPPGLRVYPGQTKSETRSDGQTLIGISEQQVTVIPTQGGEIEMPPIEIPWWDTEAGEERVARVSALSLSVAGPVSAAGAEDDRRGAQVRPSTGPEATEAPTAAARSGPARDDAALAGADGPSGLLGSGIAVGWALLTALLILGSAGLAAVWVRRRHRARSAVAARSGGASRAPTEQMQRARVALRGACERGDPRAAEQALLDWACARWPNEPPTGLGALAERAGEAGLVIRSLERRLYGADASAAEWHGDALWAAFEAGLGARAASTSGTASEDELAPLYPHFG